jgi:excisionase family DNA binding protein
MYEMTEKLMTLEELGEYLRINKITLYRLVQNGEIPASKVGRQWRFKQSEIDRWLKDQRIAYNRRRQNSRTKNKKDILCQMKNCQRAINESKD